LTIFSYINPTVTTGLRHLASRSGDAADDAEFFKLHPIYNAQVLDGLKTIFEHYACSQDAQKLAKIRIEDIDAFQAFAVLCLRHTVGVMTWRVKHRKFKLSDFFSLSDEGLALVILENNAKVWKDKAYGITNTSSSARYMEVAKDGSVRKVWSVEGKIRFTALCRQVRELRSFTLSKNNESELVKTWNPTTSNNGNTRAHRRNHNEDERPVSVPVYEIFEG
jgi:hypothetical protein